MKEKKLLHKRLYSKKRKTIEGYACSCDCPPINCNPCSNTPSWAYISKRDRLNSSRTFSSLIGSYYYQR